VSLSTGIRGRSRRGRRAGGDSIRRGFRRPAAVARTPAADVDGHVEQPRRAGAASFACGRPAVVQAPEHVAALNDWFSWTKGRGCPDPRGRSCRKLSKKCSAGLRTRGLQGCRLPEGGCAIRFQTRPRALRCWARGPGGLQVGAVGALAHGADGARTSSGGRSHSLRQRSLRGSHLEALPLLEWLR